MAYGKLVEGNRVWTSVAGPAKSADINELQDQLSATLGPRQITLPLQTAIPVSGDWTWQGGSNPPYWSRAANATPLYLPIIFPSGWEITAIFVVIKGSNTGGSIAIVKRQIDTTPSTFSVVADLGSDPWNVGGVVSSITLSSINHVLEKYKEYAVRFTPPSTGVIEVYGAYVDAQLGS